MNFCFDLYFLSALADKLSQCLTDEELEILSASLNALGELLEVSLARKGACRKKER